MLNNTAANQACNSATSEVKSKQVDALSAAGTFKIAASTTDPNNTDTHVQEVGGRNITLSTAGATGTSFIIENAIIARGAGSNPTLNFVDTKLGGQLISGAFTQSMMVPAASDSVQYRIQVTNGVCASAQSRTVSVTTLETDLITLKAQIGSDPLHSNASKCQNTEIQIQVDKLPSGVTPSEVTYLTWQLRDNPNADLSLGWRDTVLLNTSVSPILNFNPKNAASYQIRLKYRVGAVGSLEKLTDFFTITFSPLPVAGTLSSSKADLCMGENPSQRATLLLRDQEGSIQKWEFSKTEDFASPTDKKNENLNYLDVIANSADSGWYRVQVGSANCAAVASKPVLIHIRKASVAGNITSTNSPICFGQAVTLTLANQVGDINQWMQSIDGGTTYTAIANTTSTQTTNITQRTLFKTQVQNTGVCQMQESS
ncbi:MAG: hypothetical protein RR256_06010, partial [Bacteroidales bacterium]